MILSLTHLHHQYTLAIGAYDFELSCLTCSSDRPLEMLTKTTNLCQSPNAKSSEITITFFSIGDTSVRLGRLSKMSFRLRECPANDFTTEPMRISCRRELRYFLQTRRSLDHHSALHQSQPSRSNRTEPTGPLFI